MYDDTDSATRGERVELSAKVLANWVAKAANLLQDEFEVGPGVAVALDLPAHWRTLYWAWATWSVGGCVSIGPAHDPHAGVLVTSRWDAGPAGESAPPLIVVTLPALARRSPAPLPEGALDEAADLASWPDTCTPWEEPADDDPALWHRGERTAYGQLVRDHPGGRVHLVDPPPLDLLRASVDVWAARGSLVLTRGRPDGATLAAREAAERVTATAAPWIE